MQLTNLHAHSNHSRTGITTQQHFKQMLLSVMRVFCVHLAFWGREKKKKIYAGSETTPYIN